MQLEGVQHGSGFSVKFGHRSLNLLGVVLLKRQKRVSRGQDFLPIVVERWVLVCNVWRHVDGQIPEEIGESRCILNVSQGGGITSDGKPLLEEVGVRDWDGTRFFLSRKEP